MSIFFCRPIRRRVLPVTWPVWPIRNEYFFLQANPEAGPASHVACTVEMSNLAQQYEVAVIDEIQVLKESPIIISVWRGV